MIIISDASALIALLDCGEIAILNLAFTEVVIPNEVNEEVFNTGRRRAKPKFIKVRTIEGPILKDFNRLRKRLDPGESEAVALAISTNLRLIIDEEAGRLICKSEGVVAIALADVIVELRDSGKITAKQYDKLRSALMREGVYCP